MKNTARNLWYRGTHTGKQCYYQVAKIYVLLDTLKVIFWTHHSLGVRITFAKFILEDIRYILYPSVFNVILDYNVEEPSSATSTTYYTYTKTQNCRKLMNSHTVFNVGCFIREKKSHCLPFFVSICYNLYVPVCILISFTEAALGRKMFNNCKKNLPFSSHKKIIMDKFNCNFK